MFSAMPQHALEQVPDARVLPPEKIAGELVRLVGAELPPEISAGEDRELVEVKETRFLEQEMPQIEDDERPGRPSPYACPDCGGVLWELEQEGFLRFRCRVGHAFTARHLDLEQRHAIETSLWSALRALEESASLYHQMAERAADGRRAESAVHLKEQARSSDENARVLREFLVHVNSGTEEAAD
jgi:two-component system chemotaxis response regulator CheB